MEFHVSFLITLIHLLIYTLSFIRLILTHSLKSFDGLILLTVISYQLYFVFEIVNETIYMFTDGSQSLKYPAQNWASFYSFITESIFCVILTLLILEAHNIYSFLSKPSKNTYLTQKKKYTYLMIFIVSIHAILFCSSFYLNFQLYF